MNGRKCFLDMDGVLVDFVTGICRAHNRPNPYCSSSNIGSWDMPKMFGMTEDEFFKPCEEQSFWENLSMMPDALSIIGLVCNAFGPKNVTILTRPTNSAGAYAGKYNWIQKRFSGDDFNLLMGNCPKEELAKGGRILIDDYDHNIDQWRLAGGDAIMIPRLWNRMHAQADSGVLPHLRNDLSILMRMDSVKVEVENNEVRVTDPETGGMKGSKAAAFDQFQPSTLWELACHYGKGAEKYSSFNWCKGYKWSLSYAAAQRHLNQFWGGEDVDSETGSKHVIAAAWHCLALAWFMDKRVQHDDRPTLSNLERQWASEKKEGA